MKLDSKQKAAAKGIFEGNDGLATLFMNEKGEFFTKSNYAENSSKKPILEIRRSDVAGLPKGSSDKAGNTKSSDTKLVVVTEDGIKLKFNIEEKEVPVLGVKAKVGSKNAGGVYRIGPQLSYKFDKGVLMEIIEPEK